MPSLGKYLQPLGFGNLGDMKDYAHASRLYLDDFYALAPKTSWIYYVEFDIDPAAVLDQTWTNQQRLTEVGMLVKSADLPKYDVQTEVLHQYNRKTIIQKGIEYNPVSLAFHDDHSNVVHNLWVNYFRYYYVDSQIPSSGIIDASVPDKNQAYSNNKFNPPDNLFDPVGYGLNSSVVNKPFFRSITIYQMNRKLFTSYKLINPIVKSWEHDKLDQSNGSKLAESKMTVQFETVLYGAGRIQKDNPTGFAMFHYDNSPSPLSIAGGGNNSIFGPGGIVEGAIDVFGDIDGLSKNSAFMGLGGPGNTNGTLKSVLGTAIKGANLINNLNNVSLDSLKAEGFSLLTKALRSTGRGSLNGLGVDLNLNLGNNIETAGEFLGTPVSVLTAQAIAQDFTGGTTTQDFNTDGVPPISADMNDISQSQGEIFETITSEIDNSNFTLATIDNSTLGNSIASGNYFTMPLPLNDSSPLQFANITDRSSTTAIQNSLQTLNTSWANDLDFVASQSVSPSLVTSRLTQASSTQEYQAIQTEASFVLSATQNLQTTVNSKYQSEYNRLSSLLTSAQTNTTNNGTTGFI
jgi:hypothetical protein